MARSARHGLLRVLLLAAAVLGGAACELRTAIEITVEPDGSGEVEVVLALDEEAMSENPDLLAELDFSDLTATGWEVSGPTDGTDGYTEIAMSHHFGAPGQVAGLLDEVAGEDGPFRDFSLVREDAFAETRYRFEGVVDLSAGPAGLTDDPELAAALGAGPVDLVEEQLGVSLDQVLSFRVAVHLPGDMRSNAPTQTDDGAVWRPSLAERESIELTATSSIRRNDRIVWLVVAVVAGALAVLVTAIRVVRWRRSRRRGPEAPAPVPDPQGS